MSIPPPPCRRPPVVRFAEREMNLADFPTDYAFGDGKDEGYSTPNFPLGEFANAEAREQAEKAGGAPSVEVMLFFFFTVVVSAGDLLSCPVAVETVELLFW